MSKRKTLCYASLSKVIKKLWRYWNRKLEFHIWSSHSFLLLSSVLCPVQIKTGSQILNDKSAPASGHLMSRSMRRKRLINDSTQLINDWWLIVMLIFGTNSGNKQWKSRQWKSRSSWKNFPREVLRVIRLSWGAAPLRTVWLPEGPPAVKPEAFPLMSYFGVKQPKRMQLRACLRKIQRDALDSP